MHEFSFDHVGEDASSRAVARTTTFGTIHAADTDSHGLAVGLHREGVTISYGYDLLKAEQIFHLE
ncbi:hypothetical protein [Nitrobacter sp.]|uniref:hypothetical protein n=1 Tax=Nitrobacter sp. TaxID=29420 RepID=UPI00321FF239